MEMQEEKLQRLFNECIEELEKIGISILNNSIIDEIDIKISRRNNKRYACCKQEEPVQEERSIKRTRKYIRISYNKFRKHHIEVSYWVMNLEENIIKNTIMHEIIHCFPYCNNHGAEFKRYAYFINDKLGYNIQTLGNKKEDYEKSNLVYQDEGYKYKIMCKECGTIMYRKRLKKDLIKKYRCGKCGGMLQFVN